MIFSFDTETERIPEDETCPDGICLSWAVEDMSGVVLIEEGIPILRSALENGAEIVGHFLPFDFRVCIKHDPSIEPLIWQAYEQGRVYDTMIAAQLDDIARGIFRGTRKGAYTLDRLAIDYLSEELKKGEDTFRLKYGTLKGVPVEQWPAEAIEYARLDATVPLRLRHTIHEPPDTRAQSAHSFWLYLVAKHGVRTDQERVMALMQEVTDQAAKIVQNLLPLGWVSFDKHGDMHRHPGEVQKYMIRTGKVTKYTKGGKKGPQVSVDNEACEASGDKMLIQYSKLSKLLDVINKDSDYLSRPYVRCSYGLAETGRSTSWGPNLQNLKTDEIEAMS
jgi:DNA polymerase I-like protein with 3'-5' exonuclease and polymerase domains